MLWSICSSSLPRKKYFPQIYFSFTCVSQFSLKQQFPFLTVSKTLNFPRKFALSYFRLPVCCPKYVVSICFTFTQWLESNTIMFLNLKNHSLKQKYSRSQKIKIKISINILNGVTYQNNRMKVRAGCDVTGVISQQHVELCRYGRNTWVPEIIFWFTKRFTATCLQCSTLIPLHCHDVL